ncbi:MAG: hypothetical protein Rubg2KO_22700 [Rubricoccaceae bacterium]
MWFRSFVRRAALAVGLLLGLPSAAQESGTLIFLDLPEGATVSVNQVPMDLERDGNRGQSLAIPEGTVQVQVSTPGGVSEATADVLAGAVTTLSYRDGRFDGGKMTVALMLPGSPQLTEGRPLIGGAVLLGLAGSVGGALWAGGQMSDANASAEAAATRYASARTESDAVAAREAHALAVDDAESAQTTRLAFVAAGVAVYAVSALDAFLNHSRSAELDVSAPRRPIVAFRPTGTGVSLQIRL